MSLYQTVQRCGLAVLLFCATQSGYAESPYQAPLSGRVLSSKGFPLVGAHVILDHSALAMDTDVDGGFGFPGAAPGKHHLYITFEGYESWQGWVEVRKSSQELFSIVLQPSVPVGNGRWANPAKPPHVW